MKDWWFRVTGPVRWLAGWWVVIAGLDHQQWGPFPDRRTAERALNDLFSRWRQRARSQGGWLWKQTAQDWVATLPDDVVVRAPAFVSAPCSVHGPGPSVGTDDRQ